ncbi:MAG: hypothetical protein ACYC11_02620 [Bellilinea sp.]
MSDSSDRTHIPFLMLLVFAFLLVAIIFFGPEIERWAASEFSGNNSGTLKIDGWDPFGAIIRGIESFGNAVGNLFFRAHR